MANGKAGAPEGNQNGAKAKIWLDTIRRHMAQRPKDLEDVAIAMFEAAKQGDMSAIKEIGDRLDGKVTQPVGGDPDAPIIHEVVFRIAQPRG